MGSNFSDYDKGQYLNAAAAAKFDLPMRLTIETIGEELVRDPKSGQQVPKLVLHFSELDENQGLILNKTNLRTLSAKFDDEIENAIGKPVIMFLMETQMGQGVRLRFPDTKPARRIAQSNVEQFARGGNDETTLGQEIDDEMPL
jgi:hypothetical protein